MSIIHLDTGGGQGENAGSEANEAEFVAGLRASSAEALERAYGFLREQADPWATLRAEILCGGRPASDLTAALAATQDDDGGLSMGTLVSGGAAGFSGILIDTLSPTESKLVGTLEGLLQAGDARTLHGEWVGGAAKFLEGVQAPDGGFHLAANDAADVFLTGMIGGILGRTTVARPSFLESVGDFLAERFDPEAVEQDGYAELLAYAHFFTNVAHDLSDEALQWCGRALEKGFRTRQNDGVSTIRVLLTCDAQAMPGATFDVVELLGRVLEEQAGDGGFAELSLGGPAGRTTQTFDAMLGIVRLCAALEV